MQITRLLPDQIEAMRPLAREFYAEGNLPGVLDEDRFLNAWAGFVGSGLGVVIAAWDGDELIGVIGGIKAPSVMTGDTELIEQFWFMSKSARGGGIGKALKDRFEVEAKNEGAVRVIMVHLNDEVGEKLAGVYVRSGYRPLETHYVKEI